MALPVIFANISTATGANLDSDFNAVAALGIVPCTATGTNTLALTPTANTPTIAAYANYLIFGFVAPNTNTGAVTANVSGVAALNVYKDTPTGPAALTGNEIEAGNYILLIYDAALNSGAGGFHLNNPAASALGTVTSLVAGMGLAGGTITTTGTISLGNINSHDLLANATGGAAAPADTTLTAFLDAAIGSTQGMVLNRGSSVWLGSGEQSWTPALTFGGGSTGLTYSTQAGQYVTIGNLVVAEFNIVLSAKGSSTGSAAISLPVTAGGSNRVGFGIVSAYSGAVGLTGWPHGSIVASGTVCTLQQFGATAGAALADTNFGNSTAISGVLIYFSG